MRDGARPRLLSKAKSLSMPAITNDAFDATERRAAGAGGYVG